MMFPIVQKLGGREAVLEVLDKRLPRNTPRGIHTVIKWKTNREIPIRCRWALEQECEERGIPVSHHDFHLFVPTASSSPPAVEDCPGA